MNTTTPNAFAHIVLDEEGVILCGHQNHYGKKPKAKVVEVDLWRPTKRATERLEAGTYVEAKDGFKVTIGSGHCGTHMERGRDAVSIPAEMVASAVRSSAADITLDYAKRMYEKHVDDRAAEEARRNEAYAASRRREYDSVTFTVEESEDVLARGSKAGWLVVGHDPDRSAGREHFPLASITVEDDMSTGRLWVRQSEYINSGPGKGTRQYLAAYMDALQRAATFIDTHQEAPSA